MQSWFWLSRDSLPSNEAPATPPGPPAAQCRPVVISGGTPELHLHHDIIRFHQSRPAVAQTTSSKNNEEEEDEADLLVDDAVSLRRSHRAIGVESRRELRQIHPHEHRHVK